MIKLPILYARTATGAVQTWEIIQDEDKFFTISGQIDGAKTQSEPTVCVGKNLGKKNETSPSAQAAAEIKAKWDKKKKSGGYHENLEDIDTQTFIEPTLAKVYWDYEDKIDLNTGEWVLNRKLNGARMVITKSGAWTRKGERYQTTIHIENDLKEFFQLYPSAVLDGECFNDSLKNNLCDLMSLVRKSVHISPEDLVQSEKIVQFHVFDAYNLGEGFDETAPYIKRFDKLTSIFKALNTKYVKFIQHYYFKSKEEMLKIYQSFVDEGEEGGILRYLNMPYEHKRTKFLQKIKPTDDDIFEIISVQEGTGNWGGKAKRIELRMQDGREFFASFKGTMEDAIVMLKEKDKYVGKRVKIYYNGFTGYKIPNFAQFDYQNSVLE